MRRYRILIFHLLFIQLLFVDENGSNFILFQGGNPLDFKFGNAASVSVQSTSLTDQHPEVIVTRLILFTVVHFWVMDLHYIKICF